VLTGVTDYYLGKQQNAVTNTGVDGQPIEVARREEKEKKPGMFEKVKRFYRKET
jgi:hypothetical protein